MFEKGKLYSREDVHAVCGGNKHSYLPRKKGRVVAAFLRADLNPGAPNVILCNPRQPEKAAADQLATQGGMIPVFIKQTSQSWAFQGMFRVVDNISDRDVCASYAKDCAWTPGQIRRVLKLEQIIKI